MVLPNLPHLKDGDVHISEHDAKVRYIAKKYKPELLGNTVEDYALVENFLCFWTKVYTSAIDLCYQKVVTEEDKANFLKKYD